jgi:hypothetical protein
MYDEWQGTLLSTRKQIKIFYQNQSCGRRWKKISHSFQNNSFHLAYWEGDIRFPKIFLNTNQQKRQIYEQLQNGRYKHRRQKWPRKYYDNWDIKTSITIEARHLEKVL